RSPRAPTADRFPFAAPSVITGLDPVIHSVVGAADATVTMVRDVVGMDCRIKSGNDRLLSGSSPNRHSGES
ncbi:MAG: hypothetical protein AB7L41_07845, partial [Flavobacteriaceae bacterium]